MSDLHMKIVSPVITQRAAVGGGVLGLAWLLAGCGGSSPEGDTMSKRLEVRGELITPQQVDRESVPADAATADTDLIRQDENPARAVTAKAPTAGEIATAPDRQDAAPAVSLNAGAEAGPAPIEPVASQAATPSTASDAPELPPGSPEEIIDGFLKVGFDRLAGFEFDIDESLISPPTNEVEAASARTEGQIPEAIKALDQKRIALRGFMLPLKVENGRVTELLIMRDQSMCCYGTTPKINEWVSVKMATEGVRPIMDQPVTLFGRLSVGEMRENGYLIGIYEMEGEKMAGPLDL